MKIDYKKDDLLTEQAKILMRDYYSLPFEKSPQDSFARAAKAFSAGDDAFAQRIYDYASNQWFMFSSPILSNAPSDTQNFKSTGLPISCFLSYVGDNLHSLIEHNQEISWLSVKGGGVGGHWSDVRSVSEKAPGPVPFLKTVESTINAFTQGKTRKGSYAAYLDVSHPDIIEFMNIRVPTGGDPNRKCLNLFNAINITEEFMDSVRNGDIWRLIDPHSNEVKDELPARTLWQRIIETRFRTGTPYLNFIDEVNANLPLTQKNLGLSVKGSNLCNEIHLVTDEERTAVCCLSSLNIEKYDEWKNTNLVQDLVRYLDNVLEYFIKNAPPQLEKAKFSASRERSIGLGTMGFHGYLQSRGVTFDGITARSINERIFGSIKEKALQASNDVGKERGVPLDMVGTNRRNAHLLAIAPNANSSILCNASPSIEPIKSNSFSHRTRAGTHLIKNKYLEKSLELFNKNTDKVWKTIRENEGSVQHLDFLTKDTKDVYRTAFEIDQMWVIEHASVRQKYICQGQSVNLFFPSGSPKSYVNKVHLEAYKKKLKGLYYLRTSAEVSAEKVGLSVEREALPDSDECLSCQG